VTRTQAWSSIASCSAWWSMLKCRSRPTSGVSLPATTGWISRMRQAGTGSALPFASSGSTSSAETALRTRRQVGSPISTCPGGAPDCKRDAVFIGSPMIGFPSPGTSTSPVVMPIRAASGIGEASFSL
jgi:hypothetical protein